MSETSNKKLLNGQYSALSEPLHTTLVRMTRTKSWHARSCCTSTQHPASQMTEADVVIDQALAKSLNIPRGVVKVSQKTLMKIARESKKRLVGGAFYSAEATPHWMRLFPNTEAARWVAIGGADWRFRPMPQQMQTPTVSRSPQTVASLAKNVQELLEMGVYEPVLESREQEEQSRRTYRSWYKQYLETKSGRPRPTTTGTMTEDSDSDNPIPPPFVQSDRPQKHNPVILKQEMATEAMVPTNGSQCTTHAKTTPSTKTARSPG